MKKTAGIIFLFFYAGLISFAQTEVEVYLYDGTEYTFMIEENGRIYFDASTLFIEENKYSSTSLELSKIQKIMLPYHVTSIPEIKENTKVLLYPNPARDVLNVANFPDEQMVLKIFSLNGRPVLQQTQYSNEPIDVSGLPAGLYLLRLNNRTYKFCKL